MTQSLPPATRAPAPRMPRPWPAACTRSECSSCSPARSCRSWTSSSPTSRCPASTPPCTLRRPKLELVIAGYGVAYAALLVLGGRLGDRYGRRRLFLGALVGFVLASLACGFAPTVGVADRRPHRAGRDRGAAHPAGARDLPPDLEDERKARARGPVRRYLRYRGRGRPTGRRPAGQRGHRRHLLAADLPGQRAHRLVVLLVAARIVPDTRSDHPVGIDLPGTVLFAATLTALLVPLTEGHSLGWPWWTWADARPRCRARRRHLSRREAQPSGAARSHCCRRPCCACRRCPVAWSWCSPSASASARSCSSSP